MFPLSCFNNNAEQCSTYLKQTANGDSFPQNSGGISKETFVLKWGYAA